MATANSVNDNVTVSGEAVKLLSCFAAELDTATLEIAREVAKSRLGLAENDETSIEIEAEDVKQAASLVLSYLKQQIAEGKLPPHVKEAVDGIERCFQEKCEGD